MPYGINHTDHLESSTVITDQNGDVKEELLYYPFGEILSDSSPTTVKYKFAGHELDSETELIYMGARYYDPKLARFISADTIVPLPFYPQSLNRFSYTMNNPIVLRELDGHDSTAPPQFSSPGGSETHTTPPVAPSSAVGSAEHNAGIQAPPPPPPAADAATNTDGTGKEGAQGTGGESKTIQQVSSQQQTQQAAQQLQVQEPVNVAPNISNQKTDVSLDLVNQDSTQQQNNGQNNSIWSSVKSWISQHSSLDLTFNVGAGLGFTAQISIDKSCVSLYLGGGGGVGSGVSLTTGLNFGNSSGWGATASYSGGGGFGGTASGTISQGGNSANVGAGLGVGSGLTVTGGYGGKLICR